MLANILGKKVLDDPSVCDFVGFPKETFAAFASIEVRLNEEEKHEIRKYLEHGNQEGWKSDKIREMR